MSTDVVEFGEVPAQKLIQRHFWLYNDHKSDVMIIDPVELELKGLTVYLRHTEIQPLDSMHVTVRANTRYLAGSVVADAEIPYKVVDEKLTLPFKIRLHVEYEDEELISSKDAFQLAGYVKNAENNSAIQAKIQIRNLGSNEGAIFMTQTDGHFITSPFVNTTDYSITAFAKGFYPMTDTIMQEEVADYDKEFNLEPIHPGIKMVLEHIHFKKGTAELIEASSGDLNKLYLLLRENPTIHIRIDGHTDNSGSKKLMFRLSEDRSDVIKAYLEGRGISGRRMSVKGFGGSQPLVDNKTVKNREKNRRVEFTISKI
jgi:outer membrane protein OmpA-like peptidoglycan-associated protein